MKRITIGMLSFITALNIVSCKKIEQDHTKPVTLQGSASPIVSNGWRKMGDFFNDNAENINFAFVLDGKAYFQVSMNYQDLPSDFWQYDPAANAFTAKAAIPHRNLKTDSIGSITLAAIANGKGLVGIGKMSVHGLREIMTYDPVTDTWSDKSDFPFPNIAPTGFCVIGDKAYILGYEGVDGVQRNDCFEYDIAQDKWTTKQIMFFASSYGLTKNVSVIDDKAYVLAWDIDLDTLAVHEYNPATRQTKRLKAAPFMLVPEVRYVLDGKIYYYLGHRNTNTKAPTNEIWQYDPALNQWTKMNDFGGPIRYYDFGFSIGSKAYICFGFDSGTKYQDIWEFNP